MVSCFPRASRSSRLPQIVPFVAAACFWLVVALKIIIWQSLKATTYFSLFGFLSLDLTPQTMAQSPLTRAPPRAPPLKHLPYRFRRLLVDCWVSWSIGSHLRPRRRVPLYFLMGLVFAPTRTARPQQLSQAPRAFGWLLGEWGRAQRGAINKIWWRGGVNIMAAAEKKVKYVSPCSGWHTILYSSCTQGKNRAM